MTDTAVEERSSPGTAFTVASAPARAGHAHVQQDDSLLLPTRPPHGRLRRDLRASVGDATACGVMVGTGETYLPAFALAAGLGDVFAGLVASVPQLVGGVMQLISPRGVRLFGSHRRWVVCCAALQGLSFIPLVIAAGCGSVSMTLAMGVAMLYWSAGLASNPPWNTWMGTIVPNRVRSRYFALRTRMQQAAVLGGFLFSGVAIQFGALPTNALAGFALLFSMAVVCRFVSVRCLAMTSEPEPMPAQLRHVRLPALLRRFTRGAEGRRLMYFSLVQGAAYFAGPYFAPYMLRVLKLSYFDYMILISTAYAARIASLSLWGHVAARFGVRRLLWIGGLGIVPSAGAWVFSDHFWYLVIVQLAGGAAWSAYELAVFLICFNSIKAEERTSVLTLFNLATTAAMVAGSLLGGAVLLLFGPTRSVYYVLFAGSSLLRIGTLPYLRKIPNRLIEHRHRASRLPSAHSSASRRRLTPGNPREESPQPDGPSGSGPLRSAPFADTQRAA